MKKFEKLNAAIVGCSGDSVTAQAKFKDKYALNFILLSDPRHDVVEAYDAWRMKMFLGKSFFGIARMTYWVGPDGKIRKIWEKASSKGHAAQILAALGEG